MRPSDVPTELQVKNLTGETLNIGGFIQVPPFATVDMKLGLLADHRRVSAYRATAGAVRAKILKIVTPGAKLLDEAPAKVVAQDVQVKSQQRLPQGTERPDFTAESAVQPDPATVPAPKASKAEKMAEKPAEPIPPVADPEAEARAAQEVADAEALAELEAEERAAEEAAEMARAIAEEEAAAEAAAGEDKEDSDGDDEIDLTEDEILAAMAELRQIKGVGEVVATKLIEKGITSLRQFIDACDSHLIPIVIINENNLPGMRQQALDLLSLEQSPQESASGQSADEASSTLMDI